MVYALSVENLCKTYANGHVALGGIDLTVEQGDFFALLGPNGAGKSTMIGIVSSLVNKSSGKVTLFGYDLEKQTLLAKKQLGIVPQEFNLNLFEKAEDILVTQAGYYGIPAGQAKERAEYYLNKLSLWDKRSEQARMLSGGMKRRLMVARALVHQPKLLILDEPTAGVDIEIRRSLWEFISEINDLGTTVILTTHYLEEAERLCKHIAILNNGKIIKNTSMRSLLEQLQTQNLVLSLENPIQEIFQLEGCQLILKDPTTLEVEIPKEKGLSTLFEQLSRHNIRVLSMRNRENRLETLFLNLTAN